MGGLWAGEHRAALAGLGLLALQEGFLDLVSHLWAGGPRLGSRGRRGEGPIRVGGLQFEACLRVTVRRIAVPWRLRP